MPQHLFEDCETWRQEAKEKLDLFEKNMDTPNFINYDMLEVNSGQDIINYGEQVVYGLEQHKDVKFSEVESQVA